MKRVRPLCAQCHGPIDKVPEQMVIVENGQQVIGDFHTPQCAEHFRIKKSDRVVSRVVPSDFQAAS